MPNNKAVDFLKTFTKKEWLGCRQYLVGKKGGQSQLIDIFDHLYACRKDLDSSKVQLVPSYDRLKRNKQTLKDFQNQTYRLRDLIEEFLVIEQLLSDKASFQKEKLLLEVLKERGLEPYFYKQIKKTRKKATEQPKDRWYHLQQLELHDLEYFHPSTPKISQSRSIEHAVRELNHLTHALKIRYGAELLSRNQILDEEYVLDEIESIIKKVLHEQDMHPEYQSLFSNVFMMIQKGEESSYLSLKDQYQEDHEKINNSEQRAIHGYLLNYCIQQIQKNNLAYVKEIGELYDIAEEHQILLDENSLSSTRFGNLIDLLAKSKEFERAQRFIDDHSAKIQPEFQEESIVIANSIILFERGKYGQVMKTLSSLKGFALPGNELRSRWLQLCSLFEEKEFLLLESYIKGTKEYLRRNKDLGENHKKGTLNLIKMINYLKVPKYHKKRKDQEMLREELEQMDFIYFKTWILRKIDES